VHVPVGGEAAGQLPHFRPQLVLLAGLMMELRALLRSVTDPAQDAASAVGRFVGQMVVSPLPRPPWDVQRAVT